MVWFTSDLHLNHDRDWLWGPRGFSNVHEMNEQIIKNFNSVLSYEDHLFILGDLMLCDNSAISLIKQINAKIHVIRGNHDTDTRLELYKDCYNIVEICEAKYFKYNGHHFFLCHFPTLVSNWSDDKNFKSRMINLCGHTHTEDKFKDFDKGLIYHVEVDAHNCFPVNLDTILEEIKEEYDKRI